MELPRPPKSRLRSLTLAVLTAATLISGCGGGAEDNLEQAQIHIKSSQAYRDQGQYRASMIEARNALQLVPKDVGANLALANLYLELGNNRGAVEILERLREQHADQAAIPLARAYLGLGKLRSADEVLNTTDLSAEQRQSAEFLIAKARIAGQQQRLDEAEALLRQAIQQHDDRVEPAAALAELVLMRDGADVAQKVADEVLLKHQDKPDAQFVYAQIAAAREDIDGVERHLTNALSRLPQTDVLTPLKGRVLRNLSDVLTQQGRTTEALVYRRLLAEANPGAQEMQQQYNDAITQFRAGNLEEAEKTLTSLYDRSPNDASALFLGLVNLQKGELDQAIELFDEHLDPETASPEMIRAASLAHLRKNRPEEALRILREALQDRPDDVDVLSVFGLTALGIPGMEEEGVIALQKAVAQDSSKAGLRVALAEHYFRQQRQEQAMAQLQTAAEEAPTNFTVQRAYVTALLRQGNTSRAKQVTAQLQQTAADEFWVWLLSAQVSMTAEDQPTALQQLNKAAALAPQQPAPLIGLAQLALMQREWGNAARYFERATDLQPTLIGAYQGIVTAHESAGTVDQALTMLKKLATNPDKAATANAVLGQYHLLNRQPKLAEEYVDKALQANGGDSRAVRAIAGQTYRALAAEARSNNDADAARAHLLKALEQAPNSLVLMRELASVEIATGQYDQASALIDQMATTPAGQAQAAQLRAGMLHKQGKGNEAIALLADAWKQTPNADLANQRYLMAKQTSQSQGDLDALLGQWEEKFPQDPRPLVYRGMEAQEQQQNDNARQYYERALKLNPNQALALNNLAWIRFEAGEQEAAELARRAAELAPGNPAILDTYGWILVQQGNREEGLKYLERAAQAAPDNAEIKEHLKQAKSS